jgi:hypothetical protein
MPNRMAQTTNNETTANLESELTVKKEINSRKATFERVEQFCGEPEIVLPLAGVTLRTELGAIISAINPKEHPGVAEKFRMPCNNAFEVLIVTARSFVAELVVPLRQLFVDHLGEPYLAELTALVTQFEANTDRKSAGLSDQVESTAGLADAGARGLAIVKQLDAMEELLANDPARLAAWKSISRVERRTNPTPADPVPAPAPTPAPAPAPSA